MIERYMPYLNYLNKNIFIPDLDTIYKYSTNTLLIKDIYEFNHYKEDLKYLIRETLENDGLYNYVLSNMKNNNYVYAIQMILLRDNKNVGTLSLTKRTYAMAVNKLMQENFSDTAKMRASLLLSYTSVEKSYLNNSNLSTTVTFKNGNKVSISNTILLDILLANELDSKAIINKTGLDTETINLLTYSFLSTGILKQYLFDDDVLNKIEFFNHIDTSSIVLTQSEQPKMMLNSKTQDELFKYSNKEYSPFELLFHVYLRMQELEFSIQSLAYIAQELGLNYLYQGGVLQINYGEYNIEYSKERFRVLTKEEVTRTKFYQLEAKILENIKINKENETKLFNNIAYYNNYYLYDGVSDKDKIVTFLRLVSSVRTYRTNFTNYVKFLYNKILGNLDYEIYMITNNVRNRETECIIPITILKADGTYYVIDPYRDIRVTNYKDIGNYLSAKEYYSNLFDGKCDILC